MTSCPGVLMNVGGLGPLAYPWINWIQSGDGYGGNSANINAHGCPVVAPPSSEISGHAWRMLVQVPASANYSGHWVLKWTGTGAFSLVTQDANVNVVNGNSFVVSNSGGNMLVSGTNVRVEFTTTTTVGQWFFQMNDTQTYSGMGNPRLVRLADETAEANGQLINPDYVASFKTLNPKIIRTMAWSGVSSFSNCLSKPFTYRTPVDYITFQASVYQPTGPWVGTITNTADVFTCGPAPDTPGVITNGETVYGNLSSANTTSSPTLNINGRGAKPILNHYGGAPSPGDIAPYFGNGSVSGAFSYNTDYGGYLYGNGGAFALDSITPIEAIVALANEVGCNIWINLTVTSLDSETTSLVQYVRDNLNTNLSAYFEVGNELWGGVPHPADLVNEFWIINAGGPALAQAAGYFIRRFMGVVTSAWAPRSMSTLKRVGAWQAFGSASDFNTLSLQGQGSAYMTSLGWDTAPNRPVDFVDVVSYATYYQGANCPAFQGGYASFNDSSVTALLHFNGANGSTTITDNNGAGLSHTWTAHGSAAITTTTPAARPGVYDQSLLLNGSTDYVDTASSSDFNLGTGDFTIDCWFYTAGVTAQT